MSTNIKIERLGKALTDDLIIRLATLANPNPVVPAHDASGDLYLTVTAPDGSVGIVKFETEAPQASGLKDFLGLRQTVYCPHVTKLGLDLGDPGAQASDAVTPLVGLKATDKVTVNGHDFVAIDTGAAGDQFNLVGTYGSATATLLPDITAGDAQNAANVLTVNGHGFTAKNSAAAGDQFNLAGTPASSTALIGANLTAGNKVSIGGVDFVSIDSGAALNQWNITGVKASDTALLAGVVNTDVITVNGIALTATVATQDTTNFVVGINDTATATNLCTTVAANPTLSTQMTAANAGTATVTFTAILKGTSGNAYTLLDGPVGGPPTTHYTVAHANFINGAVTTTACATSLAAAITGSATLGITGVWTASSGGTSTVTISSVAIGTLKNGTTLSATGAISAGAATLAGGAVDLTTSAANLAAAIVGSGTGGILGVVTSTSDLAVATLTALQKGTIGNKTVAQTGTGFTLSGNMIGGAIDLVGTAASLAGDIAVSATPGILGVVTATASSGVVTVKAVSPGVAGNAITVTQTGGNFTVATATLGGGVNATPAGTSAVLVGTLVAECAPTGTALVVYSKAGIAITDLIDNSLIRYSIRNVPWGILAQV